MNDSELENELRALRPAAPSDDLEARIQMDFAALPPCREVAPLPELHAGGFWQTILRPLSWAAAGAAVAVLVMSYRTASPQVAPQPFASAPAEPAAAQPETTRELLGTEKGAIHFEQDRGPVREVRTTYLEHHAWIDARTGGRIEVAIPREDVFLQTVAMQ